VFRTKNGPVLGSPSALGSSNRQLDEFVLARPEVSSPVLLDSIAHLNIPATKAPTSTAKLLTVGHGISLSGEITACERLVVEGNVKGTLKETRVMEIAPSGCFTQGQAEIEEAEISGVYEGELIVHRRLLIRSTGRVSGTVSYSELEIERGGELSGSVAKLIREG